VARKWYESEEPPTQPLPVAIPSKAQHALGVMDKAEATFRRALLEATLAAYRAFERDIHGR